MAQRITAIRVQEKRETRRSIYIDDKFAVGVDESVVQELGLHVGQEVTEEELQRIVRSELLSKAKDRALRLLEYRIRSRREIGLRLQKAGFSEDIVNETISRLEGLGLIDDVQFSRSWVNHRLQGKPMGVKRIRWELMQKGVSTEVVEEALSTVDEEVEYESAMEAAIRRWDKDRCADERSKKRRLISYLQRQGFGWEVISGVIRRLESRAEDEE